MAKHLKIVSKKQKEEVSETTGYYAFNENPQVYVSYGSSPAQALSTMSTLLKKSGVDWWSASHTGYIEDEKKFYITIYV